MRYRYAVFDVDGTLLDTSEGILSALRYTIEQAGLPVPSQDVLCSFIGPPVQNQLKQVFGLSQERTDELAAVFRNRYKGDDLYRAVPYPQTLETLQRLSSDGICVCVATYKREDYALPLLRSFGFECCTKAMHGSDLAGRLSKSDLIRLCLDECGCDNFSDAVMVGDTFHDASAAQQSGVDFIAVTFGYGYRAGDSVPSAVGIAHNMAEILRLIEGENP